ncbi:GNAT family N-acetyltransferase, partial [Fructobacillus ficulneus]
MPEMRIDALNEISLVPATPVMAEEIYKTIVANRDHIGEFLPFAYLTKFPADTRAYLIERTADVVAGKEQVYAIQKAGKIIGMTDFHQYNPTDHRIELGYWLAQDYTRQGITTKVSRAMC